MASKMAALTRALRGYGLPVGCVVLSIVGAQLVQPYGHLADLAMIHLLGIVFLSLRSSVRTSVLSSVVSIFAFDFFFITPKYALAWSDAESIVTFVAMLVVAGVVSTLSENSRHQGRIARATA